MSPERSVTYVSERTLSRTKKSTLSGRRLPRQSHKVRPEPACRRATVEVLSKLQLQVVHSRENSMSGQVILYFEDQADALRFALAAGSVMAGEGSRVSDALVQETSRASRIRIDAANAGKIKRNPERVA